MEPTYTQDDTDALRHPPVQAKAHLCASEASCDSVPAALSFQTQSPEVLRGSSSCIASCCPCHQAYWLLNFPNWWLRKLLSQSHSKCLSRLSSWGAWTASCDVFSFRFCSSWSILAVTVYNAWTTSSCYSCNCCYSCYSSSCLSYR